MAIRTERPEPLLRTPAEELNEVEKIKLVQVTADGPVGNLHDDFREMMAQDVQEETEALAKSHGIYLEYDRAKTGKEKDWMYMVRVSVAGGGPFDRQTWRVVDELAEKYTTSPTGKPSIRLTTRQNVQYHWVKKKDLVPLVRDIARTGFFALNGCGDNTRNVMGCPLGRGSKFYDSHALAQRFGAYFELPRESHLKIFEIDTSLTRFDGTKVDAPRKEAYDYAPKLLNRKFKIAFSQVHRNPETGAIAYDNCVELRTNDMGVAPVFVNGRILYQVYVGGGQGERNGKASASMLSLPVALTDEANLREVLRACVKVHEEWGDRKNRHWARVKYTVREMGIPWYQEQMKALGVNFEKPIESHDIGARDLHHGWIRQEDGKLAYGMYVECGRLIDRGTTPEEIAADERSGYGNSVGNAEQLRSLTRHLMETFDTKLMITPNQDLLFTGLDPAAKADFEATFAKFGYGTRRGKAYSTLRVLSGACVGLPTCRLSYSDSEQFEPELIDKLEEMGYGDVKESIGITGCERQCFRPATKSIGWVGQGPDLYMLKLGGSEDGRHQGIPLVEDEKLHLRQVPRAKVAEVCAVLFDEHAKHKRAGEDLGGYHRRIGVPAILAALRADARTAELFKKAAPAPYVPEENEFGPPATAAVGQGGGQ